MNFTSHAAVAPNCAHNMYQCSSSMNEQTVIPLASRYHKELRQAMKQCFTACTHRALEVTLSGLLRSVCQYACSVCGQVHESMGASGLTFPKTKQTNSVAFSPQANYTDRANAACRRS
jgi:hypothetical protein